MLRSIPKESLVHLEKKFAKRCDLAGMVLSSHVCCTAVLSAEEQLRASCYTWPKEEILRYVEERVSPIHLEVESRARKPELRTGALDDNDLSHAFFQRTHVRRCSSQY